jgi:predicted CxxxxCH...CXXCH cytochrome family protein
MKKLTVYYISYILALAILVTYQGCAKEQSDLITAANLGPHPSGWVNPITPDFHGKYIADSLNWSLNLCKTCHGGDYSGGTSGASCYNCHNAFVNQLNGPESCNNCHGNKDHYYPPRALNGDSLETDRGVGVHYHHLSADTNERYSRQVQCIECHLQVNNFNDTSHINPNRHGKAQIIFGLLAHNVLPFGNIVPNPSYDSASNSCSQVYCHGYFAGGNLNFQPVFNDPESVTCGSCHGDPQTGNPNPIGTTRHGVWFTIHTCWQCHNDVIDSSGTIIAPSKHIDGVVEHTY